VLVYSNSCTSIRMYAQNIRTYIHIHIHTHIYRQAIILLLVRISYVVQEVASSCGVIMSIKRTSDLMDLSADSLARTLCMCLRYVIYVYVYVYVCVFVCMCCMCMYVSIPFTEYSFHRCMYCSLTIFAHIKTHINILIHIHSIVCLRMEVR